MRQQNICLHALGGDFGNTHSPASLAFMNVLNKRDLSERQRIRLQGLAELLGSATQDGFVKLAKDANDGRYEEARRAV